MIICNWQLEKRKVQNRKKAQIEKKKWYYVYRGLLFPTRGHPVFAELLLGLWVLSPAAGHTTPALLNGPGIAGRLCCVWLLLLVSSC